jgi:hypothetical protein
MSTQTMTPMLWESTYPPHSRDTESGQTGLAQLSQNLSWQCSPAYSNMLVLRAEYR